MLTEAGSKCDTVPTDSYVKKFSFKAKMSMFTVKIFLKKNAFWPFWTLHKGFTGWHPYKIGGVAAWTDRCAHTGSLNNVFVLLSEACLILSSDKRYVILSR